MATNRKVVFRNGEIYHVFNRGVDRRSIFTNTKEFERAKNLVKFYRHKDIPIRFSQVNQQPQEARDQILNDLYKSDRLVDILAFCIMPNHFHFLLKQNYERGIPVFIANFTNAYTKYSNIRHQRIGPLFEGVFKAVFIESTEQLLHVSRYIHLNPVTSCIIEENQLDSYDWSSYPEYLFLSREEIAQKKLILDMFKSAKDYQEFVVNQIDYGSKLETIKHLILE